MFKSVVYSILAASLANAGTIPLGKLADVDKIGTQKISSHFWVVPDHTTLSLATMVFLVICLKVVK